MPIVKNDDWCDCIIDDSTPNIIARASFFFSIYRNMYVEYKVEIQIREKFLSSKDPHHVLSKDHKTELARRTPQDGAGATETARRSWRDEDRCNGDYDMA